MTLKVRDTLSWRTTLKAKERRMIKELLEALVKGEKTSEEVISAINESYKDMVPRARLNDKNSEIKRLEKEIEKRDDQLDTLSQEVKGNEELEGTIRQLKKDNQSAKEQYEAEITKLKFDAALDKSLLAAKAKNTKAVKALLDMDMVKLDGDSLIGLSEQLQNLQESESYLFEVESGTDDLDEYNPGSGQKFNPPPGKGKEGYDDARAQVRALMGRK